MNEMQKNRCADCIRKTPVQKNQKCFECGHYALTSELKGFTMLLRCDHCDLDLAGASFYAPCEEDDRRFSVTVHAIPVPQMVKAAKLLHKGVVEIKHTLDVGKPVVADDMALERAVTIYEALYEMGISAQLTPDLLADCPELLTCPVRIRMHRL